MYDLQEIVLALKPRVGIKPHGDTDLPEDVSADNSQSLSGLFTDNFHRLCTSKNLALSSDKTLNEAIDEAKASAVINSINDVFDSKKLNRNTKTILESIYLFDGAGSRHERVINTGRFVGFEIVLKRHKHMSAIIEKIGTHFTEQFNGLQMYVFNEAQNEPIATATINQDKAFHFKWSQPGAEFKLPYAGENTDAGGRWWIGYFESDLPVGAQSITRTSYDWRYGPCNTCSASVSDRTYFRQWSQYMQIFPVEVGQSRLNGRELFDVNSVTRNYSNNFGLNLAITVKCDLTQFIIKNSYVLDSLLAEYMAYEMMKSMAFSTKTSGETEIIRNMAAHEINRKEGGIQESIREKVKSVEYDLSGFNSSCLPCQGGKYKVRTEQIL